MNRRKFLSLVGAAASVASIPFLGRSATPAPSGTFGTGVTYTATKFERLPLPITPLQEGIEVSDWKLLYRSVILNEAWMARIESSANAELTNRLAP